MNDEGDLLLRRVTAHECGHVLLARIFDLPTGVTIIPGPNYLGRTFGPNATPGSCLSNSDDFYVEAAPLMSAIGVPRSDAAVLLAHAQVRSIELAAGRAAELIAFPELEPLVSENDRRESINSASLFCCSQMAIDVFLQYAVAEATSLIVEHRDVFDALREALFEHKTMSNEEIDAVIYAVLVARDLKIEHARRAQMLEMQNSARKFEEILRG